MARISIIVLNYNGKELIGGCLKALERQSFKDFKVVIVDNGSFDSSVFEIQRLLEETPITPLLKSGSLEKNLGFAGGNLERLRYANGEYIALLNNDTEPDRRWLEELLKAMDSVPKVGICASKLLVHGTNIIDSAGDGFSTLLRGFKRGEGGESLFI